MNNYFFITFLFFMFVQPVYSSDNMKKDIFIVSSGGGLIEYSLTNNKLKRLDCLLSNKQWNNVYWPIYDKKRGLIYFEAENEKFGHSRQIFCVSVSNKKKSVTQVTKGRRPSISLNGHMLAYYLHPNQLWVLDKSNNKKKKVLSNIADYQPVVWISNQHLLYTDINGYLMRLDVASGKTNCTGHKNIIPGALSPDGNSVLCGSYSGHKIFIYTISDNEIRTLIKSKIYSMGSSFVWSSDGKYFLYTKQTLSNLIKFEESRSLFLYLILPKGKEIKLVEKFSLFGGVSIMKLPVANHGVL